MSDPQIAMKLPRVVDPRKLANQGAQLQGAVALDEMPRLAKSVLKLGAADVHLQFRRDEQYRYIIEGAFSLDVDMTCQRCLNPVQADIEGTLSVGVVWDEAKAAELPKRLDPWLVETESADLYELVEDEFLLALPIVPFHDKAECAASGHFSTGEHEEVKENPFSVLAKLKK